MLRQLSSSDDWTTEIAKKNSILFSLLLIRNDRKAEKSKVFFQPVSKLRYEFGRKIIPKYMDYQNKEQIKFGLSRNKR